MLTMKVKVNYVPQGLVYCREVCRQSIKKLWVIFFFLLIFTFDVTLTLIYTNIKSAQVLIGVYHHNKFEHDTVKNVDTRL